MTPEQTLQRDIAYLGRLNASYDALQLPHGVDRINAAFRSTLDPPWTLANLVTVKFGRGAGCEIHVGDPLEMQ